MSTMITSKELSYVDLWASKIPMLGIEYSLNVMNQVKQCYEIYSDKYQSKEYSLIFSNGEEINFEILASNLCHMLGIDYQNVKDPVFADYRQENLNIKSNSFSSKELLEAILENAERIVELDNNRDVRLKLLNYYKVQIKCNIFKKLSDFEKFDFAAINYDPKDGKYDYANQKLFFVPSNEALCPYFMMGIKLSSTDDGSYIVSTLKAPLHADFKNYVDNQEVIIPTQILVSDNNDLRKYYATGSDRSRLLRMYNLLIKEYGIPYRLNTNSDYEIMVNNMARQEAEEAYPKVKRI